MKENDNTATVKSLAELIDDSSGVVELFFNSNGRSVGVSSVEYDSRRARPGSLFVAVEGYATDGHRYVEQVAEAGVPAVVVSRKRADEFRHLIEKGVALLVSDNTRKALSALSASFYGYPSRDMKILGVTGTNGKTSITYMVESVLRECGFSVGVIGTINYRWNGHEYPSANTTPESQDLQKTLAAMRGDGVEYVVMEVSSHALQLNRVDDIYFDVAAFTNLTGDHLDFHHSLEEYYQAKKRIFHLLENSRKAKKIGIVNTDDFYGERLFKKATSYSYPMVSFGLNPGAYFRPERDSIENRMTGLRYRLDSPDRGLQVELNCVGTFHVYNSLAALSILSSLDIPYGMILKGLKSLSGVPGRFDVIASKLGISVVIDYAHTGDALQKLLESVNELRTARVITVFGCGGDRDRTKRPVMGRVAAENSDFVIVTSDNPRTENPGAIIADITAGISSDNYRVIEDRRQAIREALFIAQPGDIVVIAGKGHETYQIVGTEKSHFDDHEEARDALKDRGSL